MIKIALLLSFTLVLFASENLSFGGSNSKNETVKKQKDHIKYTIQIFTAKTEKTAKKIIKNVPKNLKEDIHLYKIGKYIAVRYGRSDDLNSLKSEIEKFKQLGFKDAYAVQTTVWHMENSILDVTPQKIAQSDKKTTSHTTQKSGVVEIQHSANKYTRSNMLQKADKAYKSGDESTAMLYYEMINNSGGATDNVRNNLCYLYGKRGAWAEAKRIIEKQKYASNLIYAYAYGAIQTNQDNFSKDFAEYIMMDRTGRLALLAGYYFEQREDMQRALAYYKMSYTKNPSDVYNMFAYARALDIKHEDTKALKFYKKILSRINKNNEYYDVVRARISQLEEQL